MVFAPEVGTVTGRGVGSPVAAMSAGMALPRATAIFSLGSSTSIDSGRSTTGGVRS